MELVNIIPPIPSISPRFGEIQNISLVVTPDIANGEIGFISNLPVVLHEPEDSAAEVVSRLFLLMGPSESEIRHRQFPFFRVNITELTDLEKLHHLQQVFNMSFDISN